MGWLAALTVIVVAIAVLLVLKARSPRLATNEFPYRKNDSLFTPAERSFLGVLDQMLGARYRIMGKVRIADVISVMPMKDRRQWQGAFNRINAKHFDFVLCDQETLSPLAVIELDDKSHNATQRHQRDLFVNGVCEAASLTLLRVPARRVYSCSDVERLVVNALHREESHSSAGATTSAEAGNAKSEVSPPVNAVQVTGAPQPTPQPETQTQQEASPPCPKCSSAMILRKVKRGARAGAMLWGCMHYPTCRGILPVGILRRQENA